MAFGDFTFPQVLHDLGLSMIEADLFPNVEPVAIRPEFHSHLDFGTKLALAINTEKARSEFIIAPVLLELKRLVGDRLGIFSGVPLEGDAARGLNGICDFLLTMSGRQLVLERPLVAIVEAKNDNVFSGLGQCIAAMFAAHLVNEREGRRREPSMASPPRALRGNPFSSSERRSRWMLERTTSIMQEKCSAYYAGWYRAAKARIPHGLPTRVCVGAATVRE